MQQLLFLAGCYHNNNLFISCVIPIAILLFLASPLNACSQLDRESLHSFLAGLSPTTNDTLVGSWSVSDCCLWEGIGCNTNGAVTQISLPSKGLRGEISPALANLTQISYLDLSHNRLSGTLPSALVWSGSIVTFDVSFNHLSGGLPEFPSSTHVALPLKVLNVSGNYLSGPFPSFSLGLTRNRGSSNSFTGLIPTFLCSDLQNLEFLGLSGNQFSGKIPQGFGNCSKLRVFQAGNNNLIGVLPDDLFDAASLQQISLPYNQLSGVLDSNLIAKLSNLITLDLGGNGLTGHLPESIGQLANLERLTLCSNNLSGNLPPSLTNCTSLKDLNLRSNNLSGELSVFNFSSLSNLSTIDLGENKFTGDIPESIYTFLSLSFNNLENISDTLNILNMCKNLTVILLYGSFNGEALHEVDLAGGFQNLQVLSLGKCQLTGQIPLWLSKLTNLEVLECQGISSQEQSQACSTH